MTFPIASRHFMLSLLLPPPQRRHLEAPEAASHEVRDADGLRVNNRRYVYLIETTRAVGCSS